MAISDWPLAERPREKLLDRGADALSDAELLAIGMEMELVLGPLYEDDEHEYVVWQWAPLSEAGAA